MIPFHKILVAIDESEVSNKALAAAIAMAQALNAKLTITHVLNSYDVRSPAQPYMALSPESIYLDRYARQQFEDAWIDYVNHSESLLKQKTDAAIAGWRRCRLYSTLRLTWLGTMRNGPNHGY